MHTIYSQWQKSSEKFVFKTLFHTCQTNSSVPMSVCLSSPCLTPPTMIDVGKAISPNFLHCIKWAEETENSNAFLKDRLSAFLNYIYK